MSEENENVPTTPEETAAQEDGQVRDEAEVFEALGKLGDLFDTAARSLVPQRVIVETQRADRAAFFRNFKGQRLEKFTRRKIGIILHKEIFDRQNLFMAHLFMVLWNEANRDLYLAIRKKVETINEDVEAIEVIEDADATRFVEELQGDGFTKESIYICVRINEVRFTEEFITGTLSS